LPRHPDPELEQRILEAASRLWARGGEKALTMRAVAKAAGTTTPTVYERYRHRDDILRALRLQTRSRLFAALSRTRTVQEAVHGHLEFALEHRHAYEVLFDGVAKPPSLYEPWPSFNLIRERLVQRLGGSPREHSRMMLAIWSLLHGAAMLMIRGGFEDALRTQTIHACSDAIEAIIISAELATGRPGKRSSRPASRLSSRPSSRAGGFGCSGPKWPSNLILGEGKQSRVGNGNGGKRKANSKAGRRPLRNSS
jgi:AcrR family transcriptional regulator